MHCVTVSGLIPGSYLYRLRKVVHSALEKLLQVLHCPSMVPLYHMLVHVETLESLLHQI